MEKAKDLFDYESLAFFGKVNASISHELKNVMAIISETAGLLNDLSELTSTGKSIDPGLLKSSTDSIMEEIQRGFATIRQMNRFAHIVDTPAESVNLMDVLDLAINLASFLSIRKKTSLHPCEGTAPKVLTCPFLLQAVVYQALVYSYKTAGSGAEIDISIRSPSASTWQIVFSGFSSRDFKVFPDDISKAMAASVGVVVNCDRIQSSLTLDVPETIESVALRKGFP